MAVMMAPPGVMNTEAFVVFLEKAALQPARERNGGSGPLVLVMDAAPCHGIDLTHKDIAPGLAALLVKYNAIMLCIPANTSTHLSPLDCCFFGAWRGWVERQATGKEVVTRLVRGVG